MKRRMTKADRAALTANREMLEGDGELVRRAPCASCGGNMIATTDGLDSLIWSCTNCGRSDTRRTVRKEEKRRESKHQRKLWLLQKLFVTRSSAKAKRIRRELRSLGHVGGLRNNPNSRKGK